jgi:hypothetical protein
LAIKLVSFGKGNGALIEQLLKRSFSSVGAVNLSLVATAVTAAVTVVLICAELP